MHLHAVSFMISQVLSSADMLTCFGIGDCQGITMSNSCPSDCSQCWTGSLSCCCRTPLTDSKEHCDRLDLPLGKTPGSNQNTLSRTVFPSCADLAAMVLVHLCYQLLADTLVNRLTFVVSIDTCSVIDHRGISIDVG